MRFASKTGFSLLEVMIVIYLVSVGVVGIIIALNKGLGFVHQTKDKVIAINLAKEGMEQMYNIRDTNWLRRAGEKDACWLKIDPMDPTDGDDNLCSDDTWMKSGYYIITNKNFYNQQYFALKPYSQGLNIDDGVDNDDWNYVLCKDGDIREACPGDNSQKSQGYFFRQVHIKGLYDKTADTPGGAPLYCNNGDTINCGDNTAKELHFCVDVSYVGKSKGNIELCGTMTNFN